MIAPATGTEPAERAVPPLRGGEGYRLVGKGSVGFRTGTEAVLVMRGAVLTAAEFEQVPARQRLFFEEVKDADLDGRENS